MTTNSSLPEASSQECTRVAILGTGLIGGSVGLALRSAGGWEVVGWDHDPATSSVAFERGAIDVSQPTASDAVRHAEVVVIAVPVLHTISVLESIAADLDESTIVTDVGSTKSRIVDVAEKLLGSRFVGGHPMAGSEKSGIAAASPALFTNAPWFVTPSLNTEPRAVDAVQKLVLACRAVPRFSSPDEHDQLVGVLSHLPHLLAYGLAQTAFNEVAPEWRDVAGGSFQDGARVAASSSDLWAQILMDNREQTLAALDEHEKWLSGARAALETGNSSALMELLTSARHARSQFPKRRPNNPV